MRRGCVRLWVDKEGCLGQGSLGLKSGESLLCSLQGSRLISMVSEQLVKWLHEFCTRRQKASIESNQNNELPQLALGGWLWEDTDSVYLAFQRLDAGTTDKVAQELQGGHAQYALAGVDGEAVVV